MTRAKSWSWAREESEYLSRRAARDEERDALAVALRDCMERAAQSKASLDVERLARAIQAIGEVWVATRAATGDDHIWGYGPLASRIAAEYDVD